jgi:hypothetical protein
MADIRHREKGQLAIENCIPLNTETSLITIFQLGNGLI